MIEWVFFLVLTFKVPPERVNIELDEWIESGKEFQIAGPAAGKEREAKI